jgi:hypothetical protein
VKKLFSFIPVLSALVVLIFFWYAYAGPGAWTLDVATSAGVYQDCIRINPTTPTTIYAATFGAGVYKSTNNGVNWVQINGGLTNLGVFVIDISKSNPNFLVVGTTNGGTSPGVYVSTNAGANWTLSNTGITDELAVQAVAIDPVNPNNIYIALFTGTSNSTVGLWKSTNAGASWSAANTGVGSIKNFLSIAINPKNPNVIYAGTSFDFVLNSGPQKIYRSNNAGGTWNDISSGLPSLTTDVNPVRCMSIGTVDTAEVLAGLFQNTTTNGGMYLTTNGGTAWVKVHNASLPNLAGTLPRSCLIRPGTTTEFYAGFGTGGIYRSTDKGVSWVQFASGSLTSATTIRAITFRATSSDSTVFAGAENVSPGVHEYTFPLVGIKPPGSNIPTEFALRQNYPNPFNPATYINYDIPKASNVTLTVFDMSGKEVTTLVNEFKQAGTYSISYNASSLASGVYFYKISAGDFTSTKKMILIK